jgi:flavin-dependent dehydrogenase
VIGGYGWLFPKGLAANVGLGVVSDEGINAAELLHRLLKWLRDQNIIGLGRLARTGGPIPVSGIRDPLVHGHVVFCGDAAGLTHPITGAGIPQAVFSGSLAGKAAAQSFASGQAAPLKEYAEEILGRYSGVLNHARAKRRLMIERRDHPDFLDTCRQTWMAFKGYRKRVRTR